MTRWLRMTHNPRMAYRSLRLILLVVALLLGQLGALAHGVSHIRDDGYAPHPACEWCLGYAGLDHGIGSTHVDIAVVRAEFIAYLAPLLPSGRSAPPPYLSRAPPAFPA